jgi:WD40 repeat protein
VLHFQTGSVLPEGPRFNAVDFSADGTIVGLLIDSKTVQFLESGSGRLAHAPLTLAEPARDLAFDPGGHKLALNLGRSVQLWDWRRGEKLATLQHDRPVFSMSWSAQQLAIGDEGGSIRVWDAASLAPVTWVAHKSLVDTVLFNHRGDLLVSDSWDGSCKVWDPRTGHLLLTTTKGFGFGFSADDTRLGYAVRTSARGRWGWP